MKIILIVAALLALAVAGCSQQTLEGARKDTEQNLRVVQREARRAERKARPQLSKLDNGARVTAALRLNKRLPTTIRADADTDGVRLRGRVETREQKTLAGQIARDALGENKTVRNELVIGKNEGDANKGSASD